MDAAFLHDMVLTVIRNLSLLDHWISNLTGGKRLDHRSAWLLRLGLTQLLLLEVPAHAAVNETVAVAGRAKSIVNAVLRRAEREKAALLEGATSLPVHLRYSHPAWLVSRWRSAHGGDQAEALCEWNQHPAPIFARTNPLHPDAAAWWAAGDAADNARDGFRRFDRPPLDALARGLCYVQDPSTALAPRLLDVQPAQIVLDACAAPGGKTSLLAAAMQNQGGLIAADVAPARLQRLRDNLQRLCVANAEIFQWDILSPAPPPFQELRFDRILLDVPCSNTGVMRRRVDVRWRLREEDFTALAATQRQMLERCARLLKPGGILVYSTCSIDPEENRNVVDAVLTRESRLQLLEEHLLFPPVTGCDGAYAAKLLFN